MSPHAALHTMNTPGDLAGRVVWRPEGPHAGLHNLRPDLVSRLAAGRLGHDWPALVSSLLSMCGEAHRLTARLALAAAQGQASTWSDTDALTLQTETVREHLRRMWLDWPRLWPTPQPPDDRALTALHRAPVLQGPVTRLIADPQQAQHTLVATQAWAASEVFDLGCEDWLRQWLQGGEPWLANWCRQAHTWPARWLRDVRPWAQDLCVPLRPWRPDDRTHLNHAHNPGGLSDLAERLRTQPEATRQPSWPGQDAVETGPWCRLHAPTPHHAPQGRSLWWRLAARLAELARLLLPSATAGLGATGRAVLHHQALSLPGHSGLAWVEMARGTLLHWVQLDHAGPEARLLAARVLSPTEWNFAAQGPVARMLQGLPRSAHDPRTSPLAALVVAAWDPCVPFVILSDHDTPPPMPEEPHHA